ncbi:MAG TPA: hypothetical protein VHJ20_19895 [Polyangia bacterium]|nr:hypothetical protein [Polyangia bacterium]
MKRSVAIVAAALASASAKAWALCPNCLGQHDALTPTLKLVGVFLLLPPAVFFAVARMIRHLDKDA